MEQLTINNSRTRYTNIYDHNFLSNLTFDYSRKPKRLAVFERMCERQSVLNCQSFSDCGERSLRSHQSHDINPTRDILTNYNGSAVIIVNFVKPFHNPSPYVSRSA